MGWEKGGYYTRSRKVQGRVVREYIGSGPLAEIIAKQDCVERALKQADREDFRALQNMLDERDQLDSNINQLTRVAVRAAMVAAGFHSHKGQWRKRRDN
jgi:hypothetical protein